MKQEFSDIYANHIWGDGEAVPTSGEGSSLPYTKNLRKELPVLFSRFNIRSVVDGACGDFTWMPEVLESFPVKYIGYDIVEEVINQNMRTHPLRMFKCKDISKDDMAQADLFMVRDCLMHVPEQAVFDILKNFLRSNCAYLLATTYLNSSIGYWGNKFTVNEDIPIGGFRAVNLFAPPYNLPREILYRIKDYTPGHPEREMCLWSWAQVAEAIR